MSAPDKPTITKLTPLLNLQKTLMTENPLPRWRNGNWWPPWKLPQPPEPNSKPLRRSGCRIRTLQAGRDFNSGSQQRSAATARWRKNLTGEKDKYPCHPLLMVLLGLVCVIFQGNLWKALDSQKTFQRSKNPLCHTKWNCSCSVVKYMSM